MKNCAHCKNGWLGNRFGQDVECVNGVLIDIDEATEGWPVDEDFPPAPCQACAACSGPGDDDATECSVCNGTGWRSGKNESQERLEEWAIP